MEDILEFFVFSIFPCVTTMSNVSQEISENLSINKSHLWACKNSVLKNCES